MCKYGYKADRIKWNEKPENSNIENTEYRKYWGRKYKHKNKKISTGWSLVGSSLRYI